MRSNSANTPLVSVVMAAYNHRDFVSVAVDSILKQSYPRVELIVVDDFSTDGTRELLMEYERNKKIKLIQNKENLGVVRSLQIGIDVASGVYLVPHASDDISASSRIESQVAAIRRRSDIGFVCGSIRKIGTDGIVLEELPSRPRRIEYSFKDFIQGTATVHAVACMYRLDIVRRVQLNCDIPFEDIQLYWGVTKQGYVGVLDEFIHAVDYRIVPGSLGKKKRFMYQGALVLAEMYKSESQIGDYVSRVKASYLTTLAKDGRKEALRFLLENYQDIKCSHLIRPVLAICMPKWFVRRLSRKF